MQRNTDYVELSIITVNRAELILPNANLPSFVLESHKNGFLRSINDYDDVFLVLPWTAQKKSIVEFVKIVFEFSGTRRDFRAWLGNSTVGKDIIFCYVTTAKRGSIHQLKTPNPNPNKWFNKLWPVTNNYPTNLAKAFQLLRAKRIGPICLEVNCPMSTDDLGLLCTCLLEPFPMITLIEIAQGYENAIGPATGNEMNLATVRLLFDISAIHENDYPTIFTKIESMHSFIVPVMRIFTESPGQQSERFQWGL